MGHINTYILGRRKYRVTAMMLIVKLVNGKEEYLHRGARLPAGTNPNQIARLLEIGMVEEVPNASAQPSQAERAAAARKTPSNGARGKTAALRATKGAQR